MDLMRLRSTMSGSCISESTQILGNLEEDKEEQLEVRHPWSVDRCTSNSFHSLLTPDTVVCHPTTSSDHFLFNPL
jgi:hypothetical protein